MKVSPKIPPTIYVLAGVNGAGKSSIGQETFGAEGSSVFNPDTIAAKILALHPDISVALANSHGWQIGKVLLETAIQEGKDYRFETTLGGRSIPRLLKEAATGGHRVQIWYCGLESPELHLLRVKARVSAGGHNIPEEKIRERWDESRKNLIRLLPHLYSLRLYDNSAEADPKAGIAPRPLFLLEMRERAITGPRDLSGAPDWAKPILAAAMRLDRSRS